MLRILLLTVLAAAPLMAQQPDTLHFVRAEGEALTGQRFVVPDDFAGKRNLVFIAFSRGQQADIDAWKPLRDSLTAADSGLQWYELPTLGRRYRLIRGVIDGGMRRGIPDSTTRAHTITLYIDKTPFERPLGISDEDSIAVVLAHRDGTVIWKTRGRPTAEKAAELRAVIEHR